jgi:hypothetical protein
MEEVWNTAMQSEREKQIIALAKEHYEGSSQASDGDINVDDDAVVSEGEENGAYVAAWVWVRFAGTPLDKEAATTATKPKEGPQ